MRHRKTGLLSTAVFFAVIANAQTTNVSFNFTLGNDTGTRYTRYRAVSQTGVTGLGQVALQLDVTQPQDAGIITGTMNVAFNRLDSFDVKIDVPAGGGSKTFTGNITGGSGAYKGATGSVTFSWVNQEPGSFQYSGPGTVTAAGKTTSFTLQQRNFFSSAQGGNDHHAFTGSGSVTPLGNVTASATFDPNLQGQADGFIRLSFNASDSLIFDFSYAARDAPPPNTPAVVVGGTGVYAGATGTIPTTFNPSSVQGVFNVTGSGSITLRGAGAPIITQVSTAYGLDEIAQNTFIVIKGNNLVPKNTPNDGVIWNDAPEFASGKMPTVLQGVGVKVNGVPAFVYFYCSAATNPACASDQLNVLTPLDDKIGQVRVTVSNGDAESIPFAVPMQRQAASFLIFNPLGYVAAVHANGSLIGPTSLYPGFSTPAKNGEQILVFGVGFALPNNTRLTQGSSTQSGSLSVTTNPRNPNCSIDGITTTVAGANLISPGLYQFNLIIPSNLPRGDHILSCEYFVSPVLSSFTPPGNLITTEQ